MYVYLKLTQWIIRVFAEDPIMIGFASQAYSKCPNRIGFEAACENPPPPEKCFYSGKKLQESKKKFQENEKKEK